MIDPKIFRNVLILKKMFPEYVINGYCHIGKNEKVFSKNIPKLVTDQNDNLLYISRGIIPSQKESHLINPNYYKKQVCIYMALQKKKNWKNFMDLGKTKLGVGRYRNFKISRTWHESKDV